MHPCLSPSSCYSCIPKLPNFPCYPSRSQTSYPLSFFPFHSISSLSSSFLPAGCFFPRLLLFQPPRFSLSLRSVASCLFTVFSLVGLLFLLLSSLLSRREMKSSSTSCCSPMVIAGGLDSCLFVWNAVTSACIANFKLPPDQHVNALCSPCLSSTSCSSLSRALAIDSDDNEDGEEDEEGRNYYRDRYQSEAFQNPSSSSSSPRLSSSSSSSCYTLQKSRRRTSSQSSSSSRDHHHHIDRASCDGGAVKETQEKKERREKEILCTSSSLQLPLVVAAGNPSVSVFDVSLLAERSSEIPPYVTLEGHTRNVRDVTFLSNQSLPFQPLSNAASSSTRQLDSSGVFSHGQNVCEKEREGASGNNVEKDEEEKNRNVLFNGRESSGVICSCSEDGSCRIWDLRTSRQQMVFEHEGRVPIHSISGVCTADVPHYVFMAVASGSIMAWDLRSNLSWEMTRPVRRQAVNLVSVSRLNTELAVVTKYNSFNTFSLHSAPFSSSSSSLTPSSQTPRESSSALPSSPVSSVFLSHRAQFFPHGPNNVLSCRYSPQLKRLPLQERRLFVPPALSSSSSSSSSFSPPSSLTLHSLPSSSAFSSPPSSPDSQKRTRSRHSQRLSSSSSPSYLELRRKQEDLGGQRKQEDYARSWWGQQKYAQEWWHKRGGGVWWQHLEDEKEEALWGERERKSTWIDQVKSGGKWWQEFRGAKPWWCQEAESHAWWQRYEKGKKAWWERPRLESSKYLHQWRKLHYQTGGWINTGIKDQQPSSCCCPSSSSSCCCCCCSTQMTTASTSHERDRTGRLGGGSPARRKAASLCEGRGAEQEKREGSGRRREEEEGCEEDKDVRKEVGVALGFGGTKNKKKNDEGWGWESNTGVVDDEDVEERGRRRSGSSTGGRRRKEGDGMKTIDEEKGEGGDGEITEKNLWKRQDEQSGEADGLHACCSCSRGREREGEEEEAGENEKKTSRMMERLVTTGSDGVCILWKKEDDDGEWIPEREFLGHEKWVWDCAFSEDGRVFVTAGSDGTCKLWCVETGSKLVDYLPERRHPLSLNGRNLRSDKALLAVALLDFPLTYV